MFTLLDGNETIAHSKQHDYTPSVSNLNANIKFVGGVTVINSEESNYNEVEKNPTTTK